MSDLTRPSFSDLVRVFARIGCLSFGGPAGQIALMHRELVDERRWIDEASYLRGLNFCHLLPGPEAQQLATWIGWRLHGARGGISAGMLFVLPGAAVILALSILYGFAAHLDWFAALFLGIKAAVLAIVVQALLRIARRTLDTGFKRAVAATAFIALFVFDIPFPAIVVGAAIFGAVTVTLRADWLALKPIVPVHGTGRPWAATVRAVLIWGAIWALPLVTIWFTLGPDHILWQIGSFFARLALVSFGGAYAVLAYMAQDAVHTFDWLDAREMADGLGLAETTPGPLIMVTQFVGYLAAFRAPEPFTPLTAGVIAAIVTTWVTFAPCFLWIFAFAPWMERLSAARRLQAGLATLTAAIVGVIANLALWFALHVMFARVDRLDEGPLQLWWPQFATFDASAIVLAIVAAYLLFGRRWSVIAVLATSAALGLAISSLS